MAQKPDVAQLRKELVDAVEWVEEERARELVSRLAVQPRHARVVLDEMLESPDASVRRAAVFGLGEMGGAASVKRLEQQMVIEEARGDHDGTSVLEVITEALGRIEETSARASLLRRLQRIAAGKFPSSDADDLAYVLWRKRHPMLIPVIRSALEQLPKEDSRRLRALLRLLETPPGSLTTWVLDASASLDEKTNILTLLDEEVPDDLLPVIPAFITAAKAVGDAPVRHKGEASRYCDRLFITLLLHRERALSELPDEARSDLRDLARMCVAAVDLNCSSHAVEMLRYVGRAEDAALVEAHRPAEPSFAKVFDDIAQALRKVPTA